MSCELLWRIFGAYYLRLGVKVVLRRVFDERSSWAGHNDWSGVWLIRDGKIFSIIEMFLQSPDFRFRVQLDVCVG